MIVSFHLLGFTQSILFLKRHREWSNGDRTQYISRPKLLGIEERTRWQSFSRDIEALACASSRSPGTGTDNYSGNLSTWSGGGLAAWWLPRCSRWPWPCPCRIHGSFLCRLPTPWFLRWWWMPWWWLPGMTESWAEADEVKMKRRARIARIALDRTIAA